MCLSHSVYALIGVSHMYVCVIQRTASVGVGGARVHVTGMGVHHRDEAGWDHDLLFG